MVTDIKENKQVLKETILKLKEKKKAVILSHNYQIPEVQELADYLGDSLELAKISLNLSSSLIVFCGVRFMAETAKILSPQKKVLLPSRGAGCPLADMIEPNELIKLKESNPRAWVVSYVNTSAKIKAISDVCCTSANAIKVVKNVPAQKIIFTPDKNLGWWVKKNVPDKDIIIWKGFCYVHEQFTLRDYEESKSSYPDAEVLVHPECRPEVIDRADFVLSTAGMLKRAKESPAKRFIIGTEEGLIYRLKRENPHKEFFSLGASRICLNMKKTTLSEVYESLEKEIYDIRLDEEIIKNAKLSLERMVNYV
jgi:quinolinate synthase